MPVLKTSVVISEKDQLSLQSSHGQLKALVVGVKTYNIGFHTLEKCDSDAEQVANTLKDIKQLNADPKNVVLINSTTVQRPPTRGTILSNLTTLASNASVADRVLFYFSGHGHRITGIEDNFLVPSDVYSLDQANAMISLNEVKAILSKSRAKQKIIVVDACMSGPISLEAKHYAASFSTKLFKKSLEKTVGFAILCSSTSTENSYTKSPNPKLSLFTYYLVQGLSGCADAIDVDNILTVSSLYDYLNTEVSRTGMSYHVTQTPSLETTTTGPLVLGDFRKVLSVSDSTTFDDRFVNSITLYDSYAAKTRDILCEWRGGPKKIEQLEFAANTSTAMGEYVDDDFSKWRTKLRDTFGFQSAQVESEGGELSFPGGSLTYTFKIETKETGEIIQELYLDEDWFGDSEKITDLLTIFRLRPDKLSVSLTKRLVPLEQIPGLKANGWIIKSENDNRVVGKQGALELNVLKDKLVFKGLDVLDLLNKEESSKSKESFATVMSSLR